MKYVMLALCLVGCNFEVKTNKSEDQCRQEYVASLDCTLALMKRLKEDREGLFTEICDSRAKTFPCQLEQWEIDGFVDMKCPAVSGCEDYVK